MLERHLEPGQYQIGNFVFGADTQFKVENIEVNAYEVNVQDYQRSSSDELQFGNDTLKPMPILLTINALHNYRLRHVGAVIKDFRELNFDNDRAPGIFAREWRSDEIRQKWGELKPLKICRAKDGVTLRVYGRPGKLSILPLGRPPNNLAQKIVAEFRRSDTLYYNDFEWVVSAAPNEIKTIVRNANHDMGDADSWLRFILVGPMTHPIIQLGFETIELDAEIPSGAIVEISSYPWSRRAIDVYSGISLNARILRPYLDKLLFRTNDVVEFSWNATGLVTEPYVLDETYDQNYTQQDFESGWNTSYLGPGEGEISVRLVSWINILPRPAIAWTTPFITGNKWKLGVAIRKNRKTRTDWQRVGFRMLHPSESSLIEEECTNRIIGRSNEFGTIYSYWDCTYTRCWYGIHRDGTDYILSPTYKIYRLIANLENFIDNLKKVFGTPEHAGAGWDWDAEFGNGELLSLQTLYINNHRVASFDDKGAGAVGPDFRYGGFGMKATQRFITQSDPGPIGAFRISDNYPPTYEGRNILEEMQGEMEQEFGNISLSRVYMFWRDAWQTL